MAVIRLLLVPIGVVLLTFPLVGVGNTLSEIVLNPKPERVRKNSQTVFVSSKDEHQLYMEKLKKRRLRRQRVQQIFRR